VTLVSCITPTWRRHCVLLERCMPSVAAQTWPHIEHLVVSDGPDPELRALMAKTGEGAWADGHVRYYEAGHGGHWGHQARLLGIEQARGEWIGWLDDDDAWRPHHVATLLSACQRAKADFGHARMLIGAHHRHAQAYRDDPDECAGGDGTVLSSMIFSRASAFQVATWGTGSLYPDGDLVRAWRAAGLKEVSVPVVTADMYTSRPACPCAAPVTEHLMLQGG